MYFESKVLNVTVKRHKIHFIPDIVYAQAPTFERSINPLKLDLLLPFPKEPLPTVIFVTGGGFLTSDRARMPQLRFRLAEHGYAVASISYRTVPTAKFPQPIEDVKSAIRFIKSQAKHFTLDPNRISLIGDSAGGYLTAFAAVTNGSKDFNVGDHLDQSSEIVTAVDLYGISDLTKIGDDYPADKKALFQTPSSIASMFVNGIPLFGGGGSILENPDAANAANPINYITKKSAPMLLMHGTNDQVVSPSQTDLLFQALRSAEIESERYVLPNADHSDEYWVQDAVFDVIIDWLDRHNQK